MVAKTLFGFEELLAKELTQLGAQKVEQGVRVVSFMGDKGFMYKANLGLRTALKILKPIKTFKAVNDVALYKGIQSIDWSDYFSAHQSFLIDTTLHSDHFNHSQYVALKSKDAIVDQFRDNQGKRPNVDKDFPDLRIHVHIDRDQVTVSLDTSGESLHRRGYKTATNIAPINEVLAAGMLMLSGWDGTSHFIGLDTHDVGLWNEPIQAGMVFTCEPGIYIPEEKLGIRLEDDLVVQQNGGPLNLMGDIPIEADEIEDLMNG